MRLDDLEIGIKATKTLIHVKLKEAANEAIGLDTDTFRNGVIAMQNVVFGG